MRDCKSTRPPHLHGFPIWKDGRPPATASPALTGKGRATPNSAFHHPSPHRLSLPPLSTVLLNANHADNVTLKVLDDLNDNMEGWGKIQSSFAGLNLGQSANKFAKGFQQSVQATKERLGQVSPDDITELPQGKFLLGYI